MGKAIARANAPHVHQTPEQTAAWGVFQREVAALLDVEWRFEVLYFDFYRRAPTVEVTLLMPIARDFSEFDRMIEKAFENAKIPGYVYDGAGHAMKPIDHPIHGKIVLREIVFAEAD